MSEHCVQGCFVTRIHVINTFKAPTRREPSDYDSESESVQAQEEYESNTSKNRNTWTKNDSSSSLSLDLGHEQDNPIHSAVRVRNVAGVIRLIETDIYEMKHFGRVGNGKKSKRAENSCIIDSQTDKTRDTPLHIAASMNDVRMIKLLLYYDANEKILNAKQKLAQDICDRSLRAYFHSNRTKLLEEEMKPLIRKEQLRIRNVNKRRSEFMFGVSKRFEVSATMRHGRRTSDEMRKKQFPANTREDDATDDYCKSKKNTSKRGLSRHARV